MVGGGGNVLGGPPVACHSALKPDSVSLLSELNSKYITLPVDVTDEGISLPHSLLINVPLESPPSLISR